MKLELPGWNSDKGNNSRCMLPKTSWTATVRPGSFNLGKFHFQTNTWIPLKSSAAAQKSCSARFFCQLLWYQLPQSSTTIFFCFPNLFFSCVPFACASSMCLGCPLILWRRCLNLRAKLISKLEHRNESSLWAWFEKRQPQWFSGY